MAGTKDSLTLAWTASRLGNEFNNETAAVQDVLVQQSATYSRYFPIDNPHDMFADPISQCSRLLQP